VPKRGKPLYQPRETGPTTVLVKTAAGIMQEQAAENGREADCGWSVRCAYLHGWIKP
jgi:hypothetical protein